MIRVLYIYILLFIVENSFAQFNFQVGYRYNWSTLNTMNEMWTYNNAQHPEYSNSFNNLHGFHGLYIGVRQQVDRISFVGMWNNDIHKNSSLIQGASEIRSEYFLNKQIYSIGLESAFGLLAFGSSFDFQLFNIKNRVTGVENKLKVLQQNRFGNTFYTQVDLPISARMGLIIRLNYTLLWKEFDLYDFNQHLNMNSNLEGRMERFDQFGVSLIFSNGYQYRYN
ncbi:MAG: hypothetical protein IT267_06735 [Saprospiraceae bacterium]|nr:hypothetical protein [Saprospiraceae bacterium]